MQRADARLGRGGGVGARTQQRRYDRRVVGRARVCTGYFERDSERAIGRAVGRARSEKRARTRARARARACVCVCVCVRMWSQGRGRDGACHRARPMPKERRRGSGGRGRGAGRGCRSSSRAALRADGCVGRRRTVERLEALRGRRAGGRARREQRLGQLEPRRGLLVLLGRAARGEREGRPPLVVRRVRVEPRREQRLDHVDVPLARRGEHERAARVVARLQRRVRSAELLEERTELGGVAEAREPEQLAHVPEFGAVELRLRAEPGVLLPLGAEHPREVLGAQEGLLLRVVHGARDAARGSEAGHGALERAQAGAPDRPRRRHRARPLACRRVRLVRGWRGGRRARCDGRRGRRRLWRRRRVWHDDGGRRQSLHLRRRRRRIGARRQPHRETAAAGSGLEALAADRLLLGPDVRGARLWERRRARFGAGVDLDLQRPLRDDGLGLQPPCLELPLQLGVCVVGARSDRGQELRADRVDARVAWHDVLGIGEPRRRPIGVCVVH